MEVTEEQRKRAEGNRLAAMAKRRAFMESASYQQEQHRDTWRLFKCEKLTSNGTAHFTKESRNAMHSPDVKAHLPEKFLARLEICSPDSFSVTPVAMQGFAYPGEKESLQRLSDILSSVMPSHYTQNHGGGQACVYKLWDYSEVLVCLKKSKGIDIEEVPWVTFTVVEKLSHSFVSGSWEPCRPEHLSDEEVGHLIGKLPKTLLDTLLPFQLDGLKFALQRGGRCLIADEMGLGKTLQAIAIASCFMNEGSILVVCPAILRFSWAEELERWLPFCLPSDIHLVFGHRNNPTYLTRWPRVVVISYTMLHHLRKSMLEQEWALLIVDESHHLRCSKKKSEPEEVKALLDVAEKIKRIVLLSGTPSLSRPYDIFHQINMLWPGLLGKDKHEFAKTYCNVKYVRGPQGKLFQDFSKGVRLQELNVLLKQSVMIRRLKEHVLMQLPPKRRQIIRLVLKSSDMVSAKAAVGDVNDNAAEQNAAEETSSEDSDELDTGGGHGRSGKLSQEELGIAKLSGFREWLSIHPLVAESGGKAEQDSNPDIHKMIIFAHHHKVLDGIQEFICEKGIGFVRIDGRTLARDRQSAVLSFKSSNEIKIAIIGITAGGVGLDFSSAQYVVFLELPQTPAIMLQAEDRAHRRGQTSSVNIYMFCAKDTVDDSHWQNLNKSLHHVSSTTNGKYDAIHEIAVESVSYLEKRNESCENQVFERAESGGLSAELMKLQDSGSASDRQSSQAYYELAAEMNDRCLEKSESADHTDNLRDKTDMIPELDITKVDSLIEVVPDAEIRPPGIGSANNLDKGREEMYQPEKEHVFHSEPIQVGARLIQPIEAACDTSHIDSLRFEVSQCTGRIHLYSCLPGTDSRPRPLFENFRPEELDSRDLPPAIDEKKTVYKYLKDSPVYRHALLAFVDEWNKLRPIEQKKLLGKPLQLPLSVELCYLSETISHNRRGLLKGGSKRRTTPLYEISLPLPSNALWKKVCLRNGYTKKEKEYTQGWTLTDEPLCKLCQQTCKGRSAKEPEYFEDLFCNLSCFEEYRLRTSNRFLRQELFQIEHGICTNCQLDCHQLVKHLKPLSLERRREYIEKVAPRLASRKNLLEKLVDDPAEGNAWHADHIIPVYRGGGECRLENMRTLCVACHSDVTAAQRAERQSTRVKARKRLKVVLNNLKNIENMKETVSHVKEKDCSEGLEDFAEHELLVVVPGSAYSGISVVTDDVDVSSKAE